jgi:predicted oxidoreductase
MLLSVGGRLYNAFSCLIVVDAPRLRIGFRDAQGARSVDWYGVIQTWDQSLGQIILVVILKLTKC